MRRSRFAGWSRMGIVVPSIAALLVVIAANPALARSHGHGHYLHHIHFAQRHRVAMRAPYPSVSRPFASMQYVEPRAAFVESGWAQPNGRESLWRQSARRENQWSENRRTAFGGYSDIDGMAAQQASAAGVPVSLVERVIKRESGGNPRAVSRGNYGLMQIRLGTARAMGYSGSAAGLLDPQTNISYAVRYLAGAYRAAGGNESRAVALYARGYYDVAKTQGFSPRGFSPYGAPSTMASNAFGEPEFATYQPAFQGEDQFASAARYRRWRSRHHPV